MKTLEWDRELCVDSNLADLEGGCHGSNKNKYLVVSSVIP
jgi:hypothetical protein